MTVAACASGSVTMRSDITAILVVLLVLGLASLMVIVSLLTESMVSIMVLSAGIMP